MSFKNLSSKNPSCRLVSNWEDAKSSWMTCKKNFIHDVDVNTITNEQIIALFPSKAVREYLTKLNWQFSDREREILYSIKFIKGLKSLRVMKTLKLINGITSLRVMVKAIIKAIPSVLWTFFLLLIFAYVYAIIGTSIFSIDFPIILEV
ncbi:MAG: ion transporter [Treponema sp.]|nr:ion transporter [Treponema sp.]